MVGLYYTDWTLIDVFDTEEDALMYAVENGISPFKVKEL